MPNDDSPQLGCGSCGYAVQGLSELKCPECGANLTEVGILPRRKTRAILIAIFVPLGFTAAVLACALISLRVIEPMLPIHEDRYYSIQIEPFSGEYQQLGFHIDAELVQPPSASPNNNVIVSPGSGPMTSVTMCDPGTQISVTNYDIVFRARMINNGVPLTAGTNIAIDPNTLQARWVDALGQKHQSDGAFTDQDLLDCFESHKVDTTRADVQLEAKQVHTFATDFINGKHQHTLSAFRAFSYGGGPHTSSGPPWFLPTLIAGWSLLWVLGLVWMLRRSLKRPKH